ncbi:MAG: hypothetical protein KJ619_02855 [Candidatus Omnitrophica bacterium]|nr:hypothetical protein [Candidatus Omnitrophota bacterium]MBU2250689.1 hypothetical protein [Candidatus Omnitrophota bacterium]
MSENIQITIAGLLVKNEEAVSELYKIMARKFPFKREFFMALSQEELIHASWISNFYPEFENGSLKFNQDKLSQEIIQKHIDKVEAAVREFKAKKLSLVDALSVALDIEMTLAEANFFEIKQSDPQTIQGLLQSLKDAFILHSSRIKEELEEAVK